MFDLRPTWMIPALVGLALGACDGRQHSQSGPPDFAERRSNQPYDQHPQIEAEEAATLAAQNQALTIALYHELRDGDAAERGFAISGHSLRSAFAMLYAGTVDPAKTQMADTMQFSLPDARQHVALNWLATELDGRNLPASDVAAAVSLNSANGVWVLDKLGDQISPSYLDQLAINYDAGVYLARFDTQPEAERVALNAWVAEHTQDLIRDLFAPGSIDEDTALVLANALYLKAPWAKPFKTAATEPAPFYLLDGSPIEVEMMNDHGIIADYGEGPGYQAIAIPLRGDALELLIVLPEDFAAFESDLDRDGLAKLRGAMTPAVVNTSLPKFELAAELELTDELRALGMNAPFEDDHSFDAIVEQLGIITTVAHQTVIAVDEVGVEAAAATGVVINVTSAPVADATIVVDRPFLLAIRDDPTDTLLFFGRVLDPSS